MKWKLLRKFYPHGRERAVLKAEALRAGNREGASASFSIEPADLSAGGLSPMVYRRADNMAREILVCTFHLLRRTIGMIQNGHAQHARTGINPLAQSESPTGYLARALQR